MFKGSYQIENKEVISYNVKHAIKLDKARTKKMVDQMANGSEFFTKFV